MFTDAGGRSSTSPRVPDRVDDGRTSFKRWNVAGVHSFQALEVCRWSEFYIDTGCRAVGMMASFYLQRVMNSFQVPTQMAEGDILPWYRGK